MIKALMTTTAVGILAWGTATAQEVAPETGTAQQGQIELQDGMTLIVPQLEQGQEMTIHLQSGEGQAGAEFQTEETLQDEVGEQPAQEPVAEDPAQPATEEVPADQQQQPLTEREGMEAVDPMGVSADELDNANIYGVNDTNIGNVTDIIISQDGTVDAIIVDVGGFLGIGAHQVALGMEEVELMVDANNNWHVYTQFTQDQLEAQPEYDAATYDEQRDQQRLVAQ